MHDTLAAAGVRGIMFDGVLATPVLADPGSGTAVTLPQGSQSPGNSIPQVSGLNPNEVSAFYNFPFNSATTPDQWLGVQTGTIGLLEPNMGTQVLLGSQSFQELADAYRATVGVEAPGVYIDVAPGGAIVTSSGERSLDVALSLRSAQHRRSHFMPGPVCSEAPMAAYSPLIKPHSGIRRTTRRWSVHRGATSRISLRTSPFAFAYNQLFVDAVLRNVTMINAVGDGGSGDQFANGLTNVDVSHANPYTIVAGGTSVSTLNAATQDPTLTSIATAATAKDPATLWALAAGGLTAIPSSKNSGAKLIETVWNGYFLNGSEIVDKNDNGGGYNQNVAAAGGVDPSQPQPSYQTDFGLSLTTSDPSALPGRGVPDVAALAGGNLKYNVPQADMTLTPGVGLGAGTSAAAPMWAALVSQFNAIFQDQELPNLGYMNDLLYIAAAIAPASFNDVTLGNNTSSFSLGGPYSTPTANATGKEPSQDVSSTGFGFSAGPGYDLDDRTGYAQRPAAVACADNDRSQSDFVRGQPGDFRVKRLGRLDQPGGPEPAGSDDVGCVRDCQCFQRL